MTASTTLCDELEFHPCGWIHGHRILAAQARGARAYSFLPQALPSEDDLGWKVEEQVLGRSGSLELRAFVCSRKSGIFSTRTEAALVYARLLPDGSTELRPCSSCAPDHGGSWVPILAMPSAPDARIAIESLSLDALRELERAVGALRLAREAEAGARARVERALDNS